MEFVADYEIKSECSIENDEQVLRVKHPKGLYRARVQNIPRAVYTDPFLLSLHLYFDAPSLDEAADIADELLGDCLNMLAFTTGGSFRFHRIRQVVDATPQEGSEFRSLLMWSEAIEYEDPQPVLNSEMACSMERLLEFEIPPAIRRAMRWYRLGINAERPDDQFMNFWFALEIVAEFQKSPEKVLSACPRCRSPLYCESCDEHPIHRPYPKQAIATLLKAADKDCDDTLVDRLDKTRNSLMHGSTLKEIEQSLPEPHEQIVDVMGRLLWRALIHQFPSSMFNGKLPVWSPSTYIHRTVSGVGHVQTIVPVGADGDFDLSFKGMKMEITPFGPPQSALPTIINMGPEQYEHLRKLAFMKGEYQSICERISQRVQKKDNRIFALVLSTDMKAINSALKGGDTGEWQDLFREIVKGALVANYDNPGSRASQSN